jgi:hypothetical protein
MIVSFHSANRTRPTTSNRSPDAIVNQTAYAGHADHPFSERALRYARGKVKIAVLGILRKRADVSWPIPLTACGEDESRVAEAPTSTNPITAAGSCLRTATIRLTSRKSRKACPILGKLHGTVEITVVRAYGWVESRRGAVTLASRWRLVRFSPGRLSPVCRGSVSSCRVGPGNFAPRPSRPGVLHPEPLTDSGRKPLDLSGSCHLLKAAAFRRDQRVPPVAR